jgi:hypothetical protein
LDGAEVENEGRAGADGIGSGELGREGDDMSKTATAEQAARKRIREFRTEQAAAKAAEERRLKAAQEEQDRRIEAAIAALMASQGQLAAADEALAEARQRHVEAVEAAAAEVSTVVRALKSEGLAPADIVALTGLSQAEVRRASKAVTGVVRSANDTSAGDASPAVSLAAAG